VKTDTSENVAQSLNTELYVYTSSPDISHTDRNINDI